jgi:hypothetical protein
LPLGQSSDKWPEFVVPLGGEGGSMSVFTAFLYFIRQEIVLERGVKLGLEEG